MVNGRHTTERCFACGRAVGKNPKLVDTRDDQFVFVGRECYKLIVAGGDAGYQPPQGGPRLHLMTKRDLTMLAAVAETL